MKVYRLAAAGLALGLLTGCASLLERSYTTSEPHSSKFWESEAAATLRAGKPAGYGQRICCPHRSAHGNRVAAAV